MQSKFCRICHLKKPLTEFSKDSQLKSGLSNRCKSCDKIKNGKRSYRKGFNWLDATKRLSLSLKDEFQSLYGNADVKVKDKLVMKKGVVIDEKWHQKKLNRIKKGVKLRGGGIMIKEEV